MLLVCMWQMACWLHTADHRQQPSRRHSTLQGIPIPHLAELIFMALPPPPHPTPVVQYRKQAKDKGIPFISLTVVDQQELARWFLPIFALYAGRISPAALTQRRRPDRWGRRSHANIKM